MAKVERGVVKPPNQEIQGLAATRSHTPRAGAPATPGSNAVLQGGSADLTRQQSPVASTSHCFNVDNARMPQPPSAIEPGNGVVPISPFAASSARVVQAIPIIDSAKQH
jgi:hypothetical protein